MEGAKEDMAGDRILSMDVDDKMWQASCNPRLTLALGEALSAEPFEQHAR
jgi:hypothetical protein